MDSEHGIPGAPPAHQTLRVFKTLRVLVAVSAARDGGKKLSTNGDEYIALRIERIRRLLKRVFCPLGTIPLIGFGWLERQRMS
jgi:hypothetical protein